MTDTPPSFDASLLNQLARDIKQWGQALGFAKVGICDIDLSAEEPKLKAWLAKGYHGEMSYMANHGMMRARPAELHPGTVRVISVRMDYLPPQAGFAKNLEDPTKAYISRYAGGRDYHKLMRNRLKQLGERINQALAELQLPDSGYRPFVDSAPILERPLAAKAGLGWTGKHSLILAKESGSWFFLGELLINLPLPVDIPMADQCGKCVACITSCPTGAIVEPYVVDGRRCVSYLTIELQGAIPLEFRPLLGNRIYGCDDCQLVCPVNREAPLTEEEDFHIRPQLKQMSLLQLFAWDEATFLKNTEGSAIRRIGHERWQRNIAVALGNAPYSAEIVTELEAKRSSASALVAEHIDWALAQQQQKQQAAPSDDRKQQRLLRIIEKGLPRDA
ncbi:tRNA epoxyqueuosine(34) reductase QueG [Shewanella sp. C32]|uniref:Epoxyqueuosine reductase n=1 Tax=Shewanella electrica TaxID=515560 RepID=A0ABT2FPM2_9GAMM|nr:tRNA epoxyqueuosine(34) reductase QueG [Shewanella electrica]MCH1926675.1 tRNA epoxyqueuosine(34) reductase QueG [Shewanella electrica]MCS4558296.1 tRNA epoxyqueuosine(34) reductase QueG [Shewanella electrica]